MDDVTQQIAQLGLLERQIFDEFTGAGLMGLPEFRSDHQGFSLCSELADDVPEEEYRNWFRCMFSIAAARMVEQLRPAQDQDRADRYRKAIIKFAESDGSDLAALLEETGLLE